MTDNIFEQALQRTSSGLIDSLFDTSGGYIQDGKNGPEYWIKHPLRNDTKVGSFSINLNSGTFHDFNIAADPQDGNVIQLLAGLRGCTELEAAEEIAGTKASTKPATPQKEKPPKPTSVWPIPETHENMIAVSAAVKAEWAVKKYNGQPEKIYQYKDISGGWRFVTCLYRKPDGGKNLIPFYFTGDRWQAGRPEDQEPYCLYQEQRLADEKKQRIIVEGEKCAYPDDDKYTIVSWVGGTANVKCTDWSVLGDGEGALIWPDADCQKDKKTGAIFPESKQPGMKAALQIKKDYLPKAIILDPYKIRPIEMLAKSWDIADARDEGLDIDDCIKRMMPPEPKKEKEIPEAEIEGKTVKLKPRNVYDYFIEERYPDDGLEQINGMFWYYDIDSHYWKKIVFRDIECNFQTWFLRTGLHDASEKVCKPSTFMNDCVLYLKRHATDYINTNPFLDSAISPYIHHAGGCIELTDEGLNFIDRDDRDESFFKKLYPITCFDYSIDEKYYNNFRLEKDAPCLNYYIDELVPTKIKKLAQSDNEDDRAYYESELLKTRQYVSQIFAYSLSPIKKNPAAFIITGEPDTGKTFFTSLIKALVGTDFVVERSISQMDDSKNKNATYDLWGSKVFIESDVKAGGVLPDDFVKKYCGQVDGITVQQMYEASQHGVKISIAMFFVSNYNLNFGSKVKGLDRRYFTIPYKNKLKHKDVSLLDKITGKKSKGRESGIYKGEKFDERPGMLAYALEGWKLFIDNDFEFIVPDWCQEAKDRWLIEASTISHYLHEVYFKHGKTDTISRNELYSQYKFWCEEEDRKPYGKKGFYDELRENDRIEEIHASGGDFFKINGKEEEGDEDDF